MVARPTKAYRAVLQWLWESSQNETLKESEEGKINNSLWLVEGKDTFNLKK